MLGRERLAVYLEREKISRTEFAASVGTTTATLSRWLSGGVMPSWAALRKLYRATNGYIEPTDFLNDDIKESTQ